MVTINVLDKILNRRTNLVRNLRHCIYDSSVEVQEFENIWGLESNKFSIWTKENYSTKCIEPSDITFIHINNDYAEEYIKEYCEDKIVVVYSGGKLEIPRKKNHFYYPYPIGDDANPGWDLKAFIEAVINNEDNIFEKLVGFDIQLETRLDFLYQCLSKEEIRSSYDFEANNKELNIGVIKSRQDELRQMIGNSEKINEYIYKLTELRNELIPAINETDN